MSLSELVEFGEFGEVVSEHAVSGPDACAVVAAEPGATPTEITLEVADPSLGTGAPFHCGDEGV